MKTFGTSTLIYLISISIVFSQDNPGLSFGGYQNDRAYDLCITDDGGFLLTGTTRSYGEGSEDIYTIRLDEKGRLLWSATFGGAHQDYARSVIAVAGGFLICGDVWDGGMARSDMYLQKIDLSGNLLWEKQYGTNAEEKGFEVMETTNEQIVSLGYSRGQNNAGDVFVVKSDETGTALWQNHYGFPYDDYGMGIIEDEEGNLFVVGSKSGFYNDVHNNYKEHDADIFLLKLNADGDEIWRKTYGLDGHDFGFDLMHSPDGGFYLLGSTQSYGAGSFDMILLKTDKDGNEQWQQTYGGPEYEYGISMEMNKNGDIYLFGSTKSFGQDGSSDFYLLQINGSGQINWELSLGGGLTDYGQSLVVTADSGCMLVGTTESFGNGLFDVLMVKVNKNGQLEHLIDGVDSIDVDEVKIAPNPAQHTARVIQDKNNTSADQRMEITDMGGNTIRQYKISGPSFSFDVSDLPAGTYIYKLYSNTQRDRVYHGKLTVN